MKFLETNNYGLLAIYDSEKEGTVGGCSCDAMREAGRSAGETWRALGNLFWML